MKNNNIFKDESGETNIVSIIIFLIVIVVAFFIFKPYINHFWGWAKSLFS